MKLKALLPTLGAATETFSNTADLGFVATTTTAYADVDRVPVPYPWPDSVDPVRVR